MKRKMNCTMPLLVLVSTLFIYSKKQDAGGAFDTSQQKKERSNKDHPPVNGYRIEGRKRYQVIDTATFIIYKRSVVAYVVKGGQVKTDEYYFSLTPEGIMHPFTIEELKNVFPENIRFHYLLDSHFRVDKELIQYDRFQKLYKVKYLYQQSLH